MKPYIIALYSADKLIHNAYRHLTNRRDYLIYGEEHGHKGTIYNINEPLSIYFADDEPSAKNHAENLVLNNPGKTVIIAKLSEVLSSKVKTEHITVSNSRYTDAGLLPF